MFSSGTGCEQIGNMTPVLLQNQSNGLAENKPLVPRANRGHAESRDLDSRADSYPDS